MKIRLKIPFFNIGQSLRACIPLNNRNKTWIRSSGDFRKTENIEKKERKRDLFEAECKLCVIKLKVKQSRDRPGVTQKVPGGLGSQIS
jgi:hypothetical protein